MSLFFSVPCALSHALLTHTHVFDPTHYSRQLKSLQYLILLIHVGGTDTVGGGALTVSTNI